MLPVLCFVFLTTASADGLQSAGYVGHLSHKSEIFVRDIPYTHERNQHKYPEVTAFARQFDEQGRSKSVEFAFARRFDRPRVQQFAPLPVDTGKLSLKIVRDGYTIKFRRNSVSVIYVF